MNEIGFEQVKALQSFAEQRDALMLEKSNLQSQVDVLKKQALELQKKNSDLNAEIAAKNAVIKQMEDYEEERSLLVSQELAFLSKKHAELSTSVPSLEKRSESLNKEIESKTAFLVEINKNIEYQTRQIKGLDELVRDTVRVNQENTMDLNHLVAKFRKQLSK